MTHRFRRVAAAFIAAALTFGQGGAAVYGAEKETPAMKLFKVITPRDEIIVGCDEAELRAVGPRPDLDNLAQRLADSGQLTVWQYAVRKGADGALRQAPLKRVAVFKNDTLRIEPYNPAPLAVEAPPAE